MKIRKQVVIGMVAAAVVAALGVACWGYFWIETEGKRMVAHDDTLVISGNIASALDDSERANWQQMAINLGNASVIYAKPDKQGRPCDPWGVPYRAHWAKEQGLWAAKVTSSGPDRAFDTLDDISNTTIQNR